MPSFFIASGSRLVSREAVFGSQRLDLRLRQDRSVGSIVFAAARAAIGF